MIALDDLYFEWLLSCVDPDGVTEGVAYVCGLLHDCEFQRRVGNDMNRAVDGADLRKELFDHYKAAEFHEDEVEELLMKECTWLEMLIALARHLDYTYDGGVDTRLVEMINNMKLGHLAGFTPHRSRNSREFDQHIVDNVTSAIDQNRISVRGHGGMFPLRHRGHRNQRGVEIWDQAGTYFNETYEGAMWTSTM